MEPNNIPQPVPPVAPVSVGENTSGMGQASVLPPGVAHWSWGAFGFNWVWGIFNSTFIALLMFIPVVNFVMPFVLGAKGREWAWRNQRWDSYEHFDRVQRLWSKVWVILFFTLVGLAIAMMSLAILLSAVESAREKAGIQQEVSM